VSIYLKVTNRCNIRCPHCFISDYSGDMPLDVVQKTAERFPSGNVIFHGGEPTLIGIEKTREIISVFGKRDLIMQTNLLTDIIPWVPLLKEHFSSSIGTSFDTGRVPHIGRWLSNVLFLSGEGIKVTATITVTDEMAEKALYKYISMFQDHGGFGFYIQFVTPIKTSPVNMETYSRIYKNLYSHPMNLTSKRLCGSVHTGCASLGVNGGNCAKNGVRTVDSDGTVYICPDFAGQKIFPIGNIFDNAFDDSIENPNNSIFYEREKNMIIACDEECWRLCNGGCVSFTYFSGKNTFLDRDPFCSAYKEFFAHAS